MKLELSSFVGKFLTAQANDMVEKYSKYHFDNDATFHILVLAGLEDIENIPSSKNEKKRFTHFEHHILGCYGQVVGGWFINICRKLLPEEDRSPYIAIASTIQALLGKKC